MRQETKTKIADIAFIVFNALNLILIIGLPSALIYIIFTYSIWHILLLLAAYAPAVAICLLAGWVEKHRSKDE